MKICECLHCVSGISQPDLDVDSGAAYGDGISRSMFLGYIL
jgi:hypothetical protein